MQQRLRRATAWCDGSTANYSTAGARLEGTFARTRLRDGALQDVGPSVPAWQQKTLAFAPGVMVLKCVPEDVFFRSGAGTLGVGAVWIHGPLGMGVQSSAMDTSTHCRRARRMVLASLALFTAWPRAMSSVARCGGRGQYNPRARADLPGLAARTAGRVLAQQLAYRGSGHGCVLGLTLQAAKCGPWHSTRLRFLTVHPLCVLVGRRPAALAA